ncbi:hypothetical protein BD311DRAFT_754347 [Dichomitus squalens]|uniref:Uncharacterized protein n=1 Tax=Dichomitus squalens TaxID=114155 RepID=A0A4Q9MVG2_9APHY|nr:hypothetical protein BD311DRAFT_754347 [Dichomitus squalens]
MIAIAAVAPWDSAPRRLRPFLCRKMLMRTFSSPLTVAVTVAPCCPVVQRDDHQSAVMISWCSVRRVKEQSSWLFHMASRSSDITLEP